MKGEEKEMKFSAIDEDGKEVECETLFTFEDNRTGKNYIVYTDNSIDEDGNTRVYASIYYPHSDDCTLSPIETEEEWNTIEGILEELQSGN